MPYWFTLDWWQYIFAPIRHRQKLCDPWWWIRIPVCRWKGHPYGVVWYNPNGYEPDMHCLNCYDDLG